jgi:hypothetical protein
MSWRGYKIDTKPGQVEKGRSQNIQVPTSRAIEVGSSRTLSLMDGILNPRLKYVAATIIIRPARMEAWYPMIGSTSRRIATFLMANAMDKGIMIPRINMVARLKTTPPVVKS